MENKDIKFVFFGTSEVSVGTLDILKKNGLLPTLVVSVEDKPQGRGMRLSPTPAKIWAEVHNIPYIQPNSLKTESVVERLKEEEANVFMVIDYGKIIPKNIFELPPYKTLNIHYSKLPKWRGASPIQSTILNENEAWVTIMEISEGLDEGPIIAQEKAVEWDEPPRFEVLKDLLVKKGGELLVETLPKWVAGEINSISQNNLEATFCKKIEKEDGQIDLSEEPVKNLRKVRAYSHWPGAYIFHRKKNGENIRVVIREAEINDGKFLPTIVVPAGKREMSWEDFLRGNA